MMIELVRPHVGNFKKSGTRSWVELKVVHYLHAVEVTMSYDTVYKDTKGGCLRREEAQARPYAPTPGERSRLNKAARIIPPSGPHLSYESKQVSQCVSQIKNPRPLTLQPRPHHSTCQTLRKGTPRQISPQHNPSTEGISGLRVMRRRYNPNAPPPRNATRPTTLKPAASGSTISA